MAALPADPRESFLPDFCARPRGVVTVLTIAQLVALLLTLAGRIDDQLLWERLLLLSLYLHWIGLCSAAALCLARRWFARMPAGLTALGAYALLLVVTLVICELAWQIAQRWGLQAFLPDDDRGAFMVRNVSICAIVAAISLRYFLLQEQQRRQVQVEAEARYQALQARIRPHFLFNSLNNIAALIGSRPQDAETAVEDLAQLFRAGLSAGERQTLLREELEITRAYLRTEALRLGERLRVSWDVPAGVEGLPVPLLCLQPLVENAVDHGVEPLPEGGEVAIRIQRMTRELVMEVGNPVCASPAASQGAGMALDNIRQRLRIIYGEQAGLDIERSGGRFLARLRLPLAEPAGA